MNPTITAFQNLKKTAKGVCEGKKTKAQLAKAKKAYLDKVLKTATRKADEAATCPAVRGPKKKTRAKSGTTKAKTTSRKKTTTARRKK